MDALVCGACVCCLSLGKGNRKRWRPSIIRMVCPRSFSLEEHSAVHRTCRRCTHAPLDAHQQEVDVVLLVSLSVRVFAVCCGGCVVCRSIPSLVATAIGFPFLRLAPPRASTNPSPRDHALMCPASIHPHLLTLTLPTTLRVSTIATSMSVLTTRISQPPPSLPPLPRYITSSMADGGGMSDEIRALLEDEQDAEFEEVRCVDEGDTETGGADNEGDY